MMQVSNLWSVGWWQTLAWEWLLGAERAGKGFLFNIHGTVFVTV